MKRFREFMRQFREEGAPPSPEAPAPTSPDSKTNKYHFDFLQQNLGIDGQSFQKYLNASVHTLYSVPAYDWGFRVTPPVEATVKDREDGSYDVTFMLKQKKIMSPYSFTLPYKDGDRPVYYQGPVEDKTEVMTKEELSDAMSKPFGMGGAPPGGPPGAPPGGGMGGGL